MISITAAHNEARLAGTLAFLDQGADHARVRLYGGTRPVGPDAAPSSPLLVEVPLSKPAGTVSQGQLVLTPLKDGLIVLTGIVSWARFVNGHDEVAFDCDAGEGAGPWEVQLATAQLYAGGAAKIVTAVLV